MTYDFILQSPQQFSSLPLIPTALTPSYMPYDMAKYLAALKQFLNPCEGLDDSSFKPTW